MSAHRTEQRKIIMKNIILLLFSLCVLLFAVSCGGGGGGGSSGGGSTSVPAPYRVLDLTTGSVAESATLPNLTAASATTTQIVFRRIPAGSFVMGSSASSLGSQAGETPTTVSVSEFWLAVFELSQGQWYSLTGDGLDTPWRKVSPASVTGSPAKVDARPVFGLTYDELALRIAAWNTGKTGQLSIPSEAQWEYACRAGTTTLFNWGDSLDPAVAGQFSVSQDTTVGVTGPDVVGGSRLSNGIALWDMHGNVREWVSTTGEPVLRGGAWSDNLLLSRSANRFTSVDRTFRHALSGARLVLTAP
jgi:formylglycine-generating enzyme required for sulfatase activity